VGELGGHACVGAITVALMATLERAATSSLRSLGASTATLALMHRNQTMKHRARKHLCRWLPAQERDHSPLKFRAALMLERSSVRRDDSRDCRKRPHEVLIQRPSRRSPGFPQASHVWLPPIHVSVPRQPFLQNGLFEE
jgi:hypothetical protein